MKVNKQKKAAFTRFIYVQDDQTMYRDPRSGNWITFPVFDWGNHDSHDAELWRRTCEERGNKSGYKYLYVKQYSSGKIGYMYTNKKLKLR